MTFPYDCIGLFRNAWFFSYLEFLGTLALTREEARFIGLFSIEVQLHSEIP